MAKVNLVEVAPTVEMELSVEEAEALRRVFYHVGGPYDKSRRRLVDLVDRALVEAGIGMGPDDIASEPTSSIYFR